MFLGTRVHIYIRFRAILSPLLFNYTPLSDFFFILIAHLFRPRATSVNKRLYKMRFRPRKKKKKKQTKQLFTRFVSRAAKFRQIYQHCHKLSIAINVFLCHQIQMKKFARFFSLTVCSAAKSHLYKRQEVSFEKKKKLNCIHIFQEKSKIFCAKARKQYIMFIHLVVDSKNNCKSFAGFFFSVRKLRNENNSRFVYFGNLFNAKCIFPLFMPDNKNKNQWRFPSPLSYFKRNLDIETVGRKRLIIGSFLQFIIK